MSLIILVVRMIPGISFLVPWFTIFAKMQLTDSYTAMILTHMLVALPLIVWIMTPFFESIPMELEMAAWVDGSSKFRTFFGIVLDVYKRQIQGGISAGLRKSNRKVLKNKRCLTEYTIAAILLVRKYIQVICESLRDTGLVNNGCKVVLTMTLKELALEIGCSRATLDRVINNREGVGEERRKEILKQIEERGYRPNVVGKMLAIQHRTVIGVILCADTVSYTHLDVYKRQGR